MMFKLQEIAFAIQKKKKKKKKNSPQVFIITPRQKEISQSFPGSIFLKICPCGAPLAQIREKMNFLQKLGSVS